MKTRKITSEEHKHEILCEFILKAYKGPDGESMGYDLCEHKAKWKIGRTFYCGWHKRKNERH